MLDPNVVLQLFDSTLAELNGGRIRPCSPEDGIDPNDGSRVLIILEPQSPNARLIPIHHCGCPDCSKWLEGVLGFCRGYAGGKNCAFDRVLAFDLLNRIAERAERLDHSHLAPPLRNMLAQRPLN